MSYIREHRASRGGAVFDDYDGLEEGSLKASSSYSGGVSDHDNDKAIDSLKEKVTFLKRVIYMRWRVIIVFWTECSMDGSRGFMSGTIDRFKTVFEKKSSLRICPLVGSFMDSFLVIYYLIRQAI